MIFNYGCSEFNFRQFWVSLTPVVDEVVTIYIRSAYQSTFIAGLPLM